MVKQVYGILVWFLVKRDMIDTINSNFQQKLVPLFNDKSEPARLYTFDDRLGLIGFIPSITEPFCQSCDRIRITSEGSSSYLLI